MVQRLLLTLIFACLATAAPAQDNMDIYTISGVPIDAQGANATEAKNNAIAAGSARALARLMQRLTLERDQERLGAPSTSLATSLATGYQIDNELRSPTRYRGQLTVSFDPVAVNRWLRRNGAEFVESSAPDTLVIPVLNAGGRARLWDSNPWAESWDPSRYDVTFAPVILPTGFSTDQQILTAEQAIEPDMEAIRKLAANYNTERVLLAVARADGNAVVADLAFIRTEPEFEEIREQMEAWEEDEEDAKGALSVTGDMNAKAGLEEEIIDSDGDGVPDEEEYQPVAEKLPSVRVSRDEADNILLELADLSQARLAEHWKEQTITRAKQRGSAQVTVLFRSLSEWRDLRNALGQSPFIVDARLDALSGDGALMTVTYRGLQEQLMGDLARRGARWQVSDELGEIIHSANWRPLEMIGNDIGNEESLSQDLDLSNSRGGEERTRDRGGL